MKVLVIVGDRLQSNSSANLCHLAYLRGLVDLKHDVTLISAQSNELNCDTAMKIPEGVKVHLYPSVTLYEKLSFAKRAKYQVTSAVQSDVVQTPKRKGLIGKIKRKVLSLYGIHGIYSKFISKASHFRSKEEYDLLMSLSTPVASHFLAHKLISSGRIKCRHWVQIWEDPWSGDVFCRLRKKETFVEEKRILGFADRVCYVSPITLEYQKKLFPEAAGKMFWVPLPSYYEPQTDIVSQVKEPVFGYFGDYRSQARNLNPFYQAALSSGVEVFICGSTDVKLPATELIHVRPRLPLSELRPIEDQTSALVFLCNHSGGQIPGKIYQYAATRKTILFILDGSEEEKNTLRAYFEPFHRFVFCDNNVESIERAIAAIKRNDLPSVTNEPLTQFCPSDIVQRIVNEGMK